MLCDTLCVINRYWCAIHAYVPMIECCICYEMFLNLPFSEVDESQYILKFLSHLSTFEYNMLLSNFQQKESIALQVAKVRLNDIYIVFKFKAKFSNLEMLH